MIFDLVHSTNISLSSLKEKLQYPSNKEFAKELLDGTAEIPDDVDDTTALVLKEIGRLGMEVKHESGQKFVILPEQFKYFWRQATESTSSIPSTIYFSHYKAATESDIITNFRPRKLQ